jgi:hypothetical protein
MVGVPNIYLLILTKNSVSLNLPTGTVHLPVVTEVSVLSLKPVFFVT